MATKPNPYAPAKPMPGDAPAKPGDMVNKPKPMKPKKG